MPSKIFVTGFGIFTALGQGVDLNYQALQAEKHGLSELHFLDTIYARVYPFGEIKKSLEELSQGIPASASGSYTRTSLLGILAIQEAYEMAKIPVQNTLRIGLINASTVGGMCEVEKYYFDMLQQKGDYLQYTDTIDCADCTHRIADVMGIKHFVTTISTACSSSANAVMLGAKLLEQNKVDIAICGGTDGLSKFTINGFNALKNIDQHHCRPFDANRNGLNLGEGAAYLVLEKEDDAQRRGVKPLVELSGFANFNESFHPTAPNPKGEGSYQVMQQALQKAKLSKEQIHYINAHGTATLTNDESEANAMKRLFEKVPRFSSTKCYTGHTLAAAGAIEAIYSILAIRKGCVYANKNFESPIEDSLLIPQTKFEEGLDIQHVMSNSYAFGGNNASLIFSKI